jgi:cell shape-determining protein MreC
MRSLKAVIGIGVGVVLIALLVVFRTEVAEVLTRFRAALGAAADPSFTYEAFKNLERENAELKARGEFSSPAGANSHAYQYLTARVYSRYPVGGGGRLIVNVGSEDGVREGMPVLLSEGTLLGRVAAVQRTESEVETIWSPAWKSAVTAGGVKMLLQGGAPPRLELVPKNAALKGGERVLNVSPEFPMGLFLGTVGEPQADSGGGLWAFYGLLAPAGEDEVETVLVVLNFP